MDDTTQNNQNFNIFLITVLSLAVLILLGLLGYIYYTKDIKPQNEIVKWFLPKNIISFEDLPPSVQNKYILKSVHYEQINKLKNNDEITQNTLEETQTDTSNPSNKFLEKMATMQKETDEIITQGKNEKIEPKKEIKQLTAKEKRLQELLKKTAKMQKDTDEMIIKQTDDL